MKDVKLKIGDKCPHCEYGVLSYVRGNEPYNVDHLMCFECDSTYVLERSNVKPMTAGVRERLRMFGEAIRDKELFVESNRRAKEMLDAIKDWSFLNRDQKSNNE